MPKNVYVYNVQPCSCGGNNDAQHNSESFDDEPLESPSFNWDEADAPEEDDSVEDWHTVAWPED